MVAVGTAHPPGWRVALLALLAGPAGALRQPPAGRPAVPNCTSLLLANLPQGEKVIYFVRHAEAKHNLPGPVGRAALMYESDTDLTPKGEEQARNVRRDPLLSAALSHNESQRAQLVLVSPLRRAMRTAIYGFGSTDRSDRPIPFALDPRLQENSDCMANMGEVAKGRATLLDCKRPDLLQMYSQLPDGWIIKPFPQETVEHSKLRFAGVTKEILARPEKRIIVVSHGLFMLTNIGLLPNNCGVLPFSLSAKGVWRSLLPKECLNLLV